MPTTFYMSSANFGAMDADFPQQQGRYADRQVGNGTVETVSRGTSSGLGYLSFGYWYTKDIEPYALSGTTMSFNFWGYEDNGQANATIGVHLRSGTTVLASAASTVEFTTSPQVRTGSVVLPTISSSVRGRLTIVPVLLPVGSMGNGRTAFFLFNGNTPGASGDSYVTFSADLPLARGTNHSG